MNLYLLLGEQTYIRNEHERIATSIETFAPYMRIERREKKKTQQRLLIPFSKFFLKHRHHCLFSACLSVKPITTSPGGQEGGG